ncbi:MAG: hypothetical protein WAW16_07610 [Candidatus Cryosericum sp.]
MAESRVEIEIYGIWDEAPAASSCGCGGGGCGCGAPAPTMGDMFEDLRKSLDASDIKNQCSLRFIDVMKDSGPRVDEVRGLVEKGYTLPLTALNDKWAFYGGMSSEMFYGKIKGLLTGAKPVR